MTRQTALIGPLAVLVFLCTAVVARADTCALLEHQTQLGGKALEEYNTYVTAGKSGDPRARAAAQRVNAALDTGHQYLPGCGRADVKLDYYDNEFQRATRDYYSAPTEKKSLAARIAYLDLTILYALGAPETQPKKYTLYVRFVKRMYAQTDQVYVSPENAVKQSVRKADLPTWPPTPRDVFTGPSGWTRHDKPVAGGLAWVFYPPQSDGTDSNIYIRQGPTSLDFTQLVRQSRIAAVRVGGGAPLRADHAEMICGGTQRGWFFENVLTRDDGHEVVNQQVLGLVPGSAYIAFYTRPVSVPEDGSARASLDSLCPQ